jgi:hypothetical protein
VLRKIFEPKRGKIFGDWRKLLMRSFMLSAPHHVLFG